MKRYTPRRFGLGVVGSVVLFLIGSVTLPGPAESQWPQIEFIPYAAGFLSPVHITHSGDQSGRLFVVEQRGTVQIVKNGTVLTSPFLDIRARVLSGGERGLLSIAFPPRYEIKRYFYVNYTRQTDGATVVSRFRVSDLPDLADSQTEEIILTIEQPFANHNGGQLAFSPMDGFLYIGMGDGGSGGDPQNYAQNLNDLPGNQKLLGKLLRIDPESGPGPYAIPGDNPVLNHARSEIWALGLRNPWRFSFDRSTGDLYMGDVGQSVREEIDFQPLSSSGGENYGWRILEGSTCFNPPSGCLFPDHYAPPVVEYDHTEGCAVTGGFVYRGNEFPLMQGIYFYGDYCSGRIWGLKRSQGKWETSLVADTPFTISSFGEGEEGNLYVLDYGSGNIYRIAQTAIPELPDLSGQWGDIALTRSGSLYQVNFALTVLNRGIRETPRTKVEIYLSNDDQFDPNDPLLRVIQFGAIHAGNSRTKSYRYWSRTNPSGKFLIAVIDPDNKIQEFDETNNIAVSHPMIP
jgi:glucose/arabinose dehydrogenase